MNDLVELDWSQSSTLAAAQELLPATKNFTQTDLQLLQDAQKRGRSDRGWGRAQFFTTEFSQYLAIWGNNAVDQAPPILSVIRFGKTGTYALLVGGKIVANCDSLETLLPTLAVAGPMAYETT
jgi:hypothetical protein